MELKRNDSLKNFESLGLHGRRLSRAILDSLPFYESVLWDSSGQVFMLFAGLDEQVIHTEERERVVTDMLHVIETYEEKTGKNLRISGLPFIRTETIRQSSREIVLFILLAALVTSLVLWFFFVLLPPFWFLWWWWPWVWFGVRPLWACWAIILLL